MRVRSSSSTWDTGSSVQLCGPVQGRNVPKGAKEEEAKRDMREKGASGSSAFTFTFTFIALVFFSACLPNGWAAAHPGRLLTSTPTHRQKRCLTEHSVRRSARRTHHQEEQKTTRKAETPESLWTIVTPRRSRPLPPWRFDCRALGATRMLLRWRLCCATHRWRARFADTRRCAGWRVAVLKVLRTQRALSW